MQINALPPYDSSINTTGCCPRFNPVGWDGQHLRFRDKPFLRATTRCLMHVPVNMGQVFSRVQSRIEAARAQDADDVIVLSRSLSLGQDEHLFSVTRPVPGEEMTTLSGDFLTKVFEGPYSRTGQWAKEMQALGSGGGNPAGRVWFFYTTCPKCARAYGKNYVVGVVEVSADRSRVGAA